MRALVLVLVLAGCSDYQHEPVRVLPAPARAAAPEPPTPTPVPRPASTPRTPAQQHTAAPPARHPSFMDAASLPPEPVTTGNAAFREAVERRNAGRGTAP